MNCDALKLILLFLICSLLCIMGKRHIYGREEFRERERPRENVFACTFAREHCIKILVHVTPRIHCEQNTSYTYAHVHTYSLSAFAITRTSVVQYIYAYLEQASEQTEEYYPYSNRSACSRMRIRSLRTDLRSMKSLSSDHLWFGCRMPLATRAASIIANSLNSWS